MAVGNAQAGEVGRGMGRQLDLAPSAHVGLLHYRSHFHAALPVHNGADSPNGKAGRRISRNAKNELFLQTSQTSLPSKT